MLIIVVTLVFLGFSQTDHSITGGSVAMEIREPDLIPEGIGYSERTGYFYLTSIHRSKIVMVREPEGTCQDFVHSGESGFLPGLGIQVDDLNDQVWAIGSDIESGKQDSRLFLFDLQTGTLKQSFAPNDTNKHFLNDLVLAKDGKIYATDSDNHAIYHVTDEGRFDLFLASEEIEYPNGIAYSPERDLLFIASFTKGIRIIDRFTGQILNSPDTTDATLGIDGLEYYKGSLVGVQNGYQTKEKHRVVRYHLNPEETGLTGRSVIDEHNRLFDVPTTCVIRGGILYCIANSQLRNLDQPLNSIIDPALLTPTFILRYDLNE